MKYCKKCFRNIEDKYIACPNCGNRELTVYGSHDAKEDFSCLGEDILPEMPEKDDDAYERPDVDKEKTDAYGNVKRSIDHSDVPKESQNAGAPADYHSETFENITRQLTANKVQKGSGDEYFTNNGLPKTKININGKPVLVDENVDKSIGIVAILLTVFFGTSFFVPLFVLIMLKRYCEQYPDYGGTIRAARSIATIFLVLSGIFIALSIGGGIFDAFFG